MESNQFFEKQGPFPLKEIIKAINCTDDLSCASNFKIFGVESLVNAKANDMTFLNSSKYKDVSLKTKAVACITSSNLSKFLPDKCIKLNVRNILLAVTQVSKMFYPKADKDYPDINLADSSKVKNKYPKVSFGKNVLIGKNVKIAYKPQYLDSTHDILVKDLLIQQSIDGKTELQQEHLMLSTL